MLEYMTPERTANAICQDKSFKGIIILVEGKKDIKLYDRFFDRTLTKLVSTFGKHNLRDVFTLLTQRGVERKIGLRDADFLRIPNNPKFDPNYAESIFPTDYHDSEVMMIKSHACRHFLRVTLDDDTLGEFERKNALLVRDHAFRLSYNIGCLRLANRRYKLGLSFKPEKAEGNRLKYKAFICSRTGVFLGNDKLINTVFEYSKNRGTAISTRAEITDKLELIIRESHPIGEIVNGHDMTEVLAIVVRDVMKSANKLLQNSDCVEDLLILGFDSHEFSKTQLRAKLSGWEATSGNKILS